MNKIVVTVATACVVLAGVLFWTLGYDRPASAKESVDRAEIEGIIYDYLMKHPEIILEAVQRLQDREVAEAQAQVDAYLAENLDLVEGPVNSYVAGNPDGDVTIVEFFDYHCTYCKQNLNALMNYVESDGNIRLVLREFPALRARAPSQEAAVAALAAMDQGKYMEFHLAMMNAKGTLTQTRIEDIATSVGLDLIELNKSLKNKKLADMVEANMDMAHALGIDGTPSFVIGGRVFIGLRDKAALEAAVQDARSRAKS